MVATVLIISINYAINQVNNFKEYFWTLFIVPVKDISTISLIWKFVIAMINSVVEAFLMFYTVENIEFRAYILIL